MISLGCPVLRKVLFLTLYLPALLQAAESIQGFWELGAGLSYLQSPHYPGSSESKTYLIPFPHVMVESNILTIDRNVLLGHLLETEHMRFDLSFSGAFKVDSEDDPLRTGMPDLDYLLEGGPSLDWLLAGSFKGDQRLILEFPVRAVVSTDFKGAELQGFRFTPSLRWYQRWNNADQWILDSRFRLLYATEDYHDYLYQIDAEYATPGRPRYDAEPGYSGYRLLFNFRYRQKSQVYGMYLRYSNYQGAEFIDSPLVTENHNFSVGVYVSWVLGSSHF